MRAIWPFRHFGLKLLSLGLAVLLWAAVAGEETVERGLRIPLELQQFPVGLEIDGEAPSTVDVRVRGTAGALSRVTPADVVAVLDLHAARTGSRLFPLTPDQVRAPFGVEVVQVTPPTIALVFEASAAKQVPIVASLEGRPAPGYVLGKVTVTPPTVEVVGAETAIKRVSEAMTEPVSIAGARERVQESVTVGLLDPAVRVKAQRTASVSVDISPAALERVVRGRAVHLRNIGPGLTARAEPAVVDVAVRGSRDALNRVDPEDVRAYIDLAGLGAGEYALTVHADAANDAGIARIDPSAVQVRITSAKN